MATKRLDQLTAHPRTTSNPLTKGSVAMIRDAALSSDNTRRVTLQEMRGYTYNVRDYGATGDGTTNDTTAIQAALNAATAAGGGTVFVPAGNYKVTATLLIDGTPNERSYVRLTGEGYGSTITGTSIAGPVITVADPGAEVSYLRIFGTSCTTGLYVNTAAETFLNMIWLAGSFSQDGFEFVECFGSSLTNLYTSGATITRYCFYGHGDFNANTCLNWYTASNYCTANIYLNGGGGCTMTGITCQGGDKGLWVGSFSGLHVNGLWTENVVAPVVLGVQFGVAAFGIHISGAQFGGAYSSHPNYSTSTGLVHLDNCFGVHISGSRFNASQTDGLVSITGGGGTGAAAAALLTASGTVSKIQVLTQGTGYTTNPTVTISGLGGSGATATAARTGTAVTSITVTAAGSGYNLGTAPVPAILYGDCKKIVISGCYVATTQGTATPLYPYVCRSSTGDSGAAITILGDISLLYGLAECNLRKAQGFGHNHYIEEMDSAGARVVTQYIPPVYP